jgi:hypothetical protein
MYRYWKAFNRGVVSIGHGKLLPRWPFMAHSEHSLNSLQLWAMDKQMDRKLLLVTVQQGMNLGDVAVLHAAQK